MGMDSVELVMEAEEAFGIRFADDEGLKIRTVGEFYEVILRKLPPAVPRRCLTAAVFYRVRRALTATTNVARQEIRPATRLAPLLPADRRKHVWKELERRLDLRLPSLTSPSWGAAIALG